jgi:alkylation response protein AidB-like acyl-CoA dehydrogenase
MRLNPQIWIGRNLQMDFSLTEEQQMLRTMARTFLTAECPKKLVHLMVKDERGYPPKLWKQMAELGWMGLAIPEEYGGTGGSLLDLAILAEEMGRACLPGPFFSTAVLAGLSLLEAGSDEQKREFLPKLARGELILTLALTESSGRWDADAIRTVAALNKKDNFTIRGTKLFVPDAHVADCVICVARTKDAARPLDGITLFLVESKNPNVRCTVLNTIAGDKQCELVFDGVEVSRSNIIGEMNNGWDCVQKAIEKATAIRCAEMIGGARQVLEMTVAYAKDRIQFDRPIGSFQVIQHALADMFTDIEGSSLIVYDAVWRLANRLPASRQVSMAKGLVSQAFKKAATSSHQIHGAIAFTEDHDLHLYFKKAKTWEISLGDANFHFDKLATQVGI